MKRVQNWKWLRKVEEKNFYFQTQWNEEALCADLSCGKIMFAVKMLLLLVIFINNLFFAFFYF